MSSSAYTPNLGIEQPATGAYANTWGTVANRSYAVLDSAIGGSAQLTLTGAPGTPQQLATTPGGPGAQQGLFPLIIWTGAQTGPGAVTIVPATQQRLFIMRNETAATIAFAQSAGGAQFTLQPGYDAHIYCDAADPNANVAAAILNPQYGNVLVTGTLQVNGGLTGNLNLGAMTAASLGLGAPTSVPDALTINGMGSQSSCHIRLVEAANADYGVLLRNDGNAFYIMATVAGSPYAAWNTIPLTISLANGEVTAGYGLTSPTIQSTGPLYAATTVFTNSLNAVGSISVDTGGTNAGGIDIFFGGATEGIGSARSGGQPQNQGGLTLFAGGAARLVVTNTGLVGIGMMPDGHALCVAGYIHTTVGIVFPDGSVQTTAVSGGGTGSFTQLTVTGNAAIGGALGVTGLVTVSNNINLTSGHTFQINGVPLVSGITGVTTYVGGLAEWTEPGIGLAAGVGISLTASHSIPGVYGTVTINNTNPSDARLKRNVRPLEGGLSIIERLRIIEAEYNGLGGTRDGERTVGVIAQELARVLPDSVIVSGEADFLHVDTREIFFQLVLAVQQLSGLAKGILQAAAL